MLQVLASRRALPPVSVEMADSLLFFIYFVTFVVMDSQFWISIVILVIVFLSRLLKKDKPEPESDEPPTPRQPRPRENAGRQVTERPKQLTFEELLREITEAKQPSKPTYQTQPKSDVVDYDDDIPGEEQDLEVIEQDYRKKDPVYDMYETGKRQAFQRPSLEETMNVRDTVIEFGKFKAFEQTEQRNILYDYTKDLKDPDGLKKAFVLTEILNRKF